MVVSAPPFCTEGPEKEFLEPVIASNTNQSSNHDAIYPIISNSEQMLEQAAFRSSVNTYKFLHLLSGPSGGYDGLTKESGAVST